MKSRFLAAAAVFLMPLLVPGVAAAADCDIPAYWIGTETEGLKIHASPDKSATAAATVPFLGDLPPADLVITGSKGDWLQIGKASTPEQPIFTGTGWVPRDNIRTNIAAVVAPEDRPTSNLAPVLDKPDEKGLLIAELQPAAEVPVLGCAGKWLKTRDGAIEGWVRPVDVCGDAVGFCQQVPVGQEEG